MSGLLASVCSVSEARVALHAYADIIDCKNPHEGALGALPAETITRIVEVVDGKRLTSATIGDDIRDARHLQDAVHSTVDCGVDFVKIGLFEADSAHRDIRALQGTTSRYDLIAVCFADRYDPGLFLPRLADGGFRGVMIDTADKAAGSLTELWTTERIADFVSRARELGLVCGLAGRLRLDDVATLLPLHADYLGFRSALCLGDRLKQLDHGAIMRVRNAIPFRHDTTTSVRTSISLH